MSIPTYSFVAYSNTGKTTFLEKLVPALKAEGLIQCQIMSGISPDILPT